MKPLLIVLAGSALAGRAVFRACPRTRATVRLSYVAKEEASSTNRSLRCVQRKGQGQERRDDVESSTYPGEPGVCQGAGMDPNLAPSVSSRRSGSATPARFLSKSIRAASGGLPSHGRRK